MSHSSGGVGGFGINSSTTTKNGSGGQGGAQVTDRLKLLKQKQSSTS